MQSSFPDVIDKVIISGFGGQHDLDVQAAFYSGYSSYNGTEFLGETILYSQNILASFMYAQSNGYQLIIRSTTGLSTAINFSYSYPSVDLIMPAGSNNFDHIFSGEISTCPVVVTGAGIDSNMTGYNLEFFSIDPITSYNFSSYSNGFVAGQLAFISNYLTISFDSSRALARLHGSEYGTFDPFSGYGKINVEGIINSTLPVELSLFEAFVNGGSVILKWRTETEVNNYGFEIERSLLTTDIYGGYPENLLWQKIGFVSGNGNSNAPKNYSFIDNSINSAAKLFYRLKQVDSDGTFNYSKIEAVSSYIPETILLEQNYPNPFNPSTKIKYEIPSPSNLFGGGEAENLFVSIKVFDVLGNEISTLVNKQHPPGSYEVEFNGKNSPSGMLVYKLQVYNLDGSFEFALVKKMLLLK